MISRRGFLSLAGGSAAILVLSRNLSALEPVHRAAGTKITVYRSASCGCCAAWVTHLTKNGFDVESRIIDDVEPVKRRHAVPEKLWSCHTAVAGPYVIEGHVPADLITRVVKEKPAIAGLAAPGMPQSAPGMDQGGPHEAYEIISFTRTGETTVYARR